MTLQSDTGNTGGQARKPRHSTSVKRENQPSGRGQRRRSQNGSGKRPAGDGKDVKAEGQNPSLNVSAVKPAGSPKNRPKIGDSRPAAKSSQRNPQRNPQRRADSPRSKESGGSSGRGRRRERGRQALRPVEAATYAEPVELDEEALARRRGRSRKGRFVGRYLMTIHVTPEATHVAVIEGRSLVEYYVSRPANDITEIHGNIYLGKVKNVLPGMEAAFVDIGTPKNGIIYSGDVLWDSEDLDKSSRPDRIEKVLSQNQSVLCQVSKNPFAHKGSRLTQQISLPGRYVVLMPDNPSYGISSRLPERERRRLRRILEKVKPDEHGIIVRTAAEGVTSQEVVHDVKRLLSQWEQISSLAKRSKSPAMLYREPDMALRIIREELNADYRSVLIDDWDLFKSVREYVMSVAPELVERIEYYDDSENALGLFERYHVYSQLRKAVDKTVLLPSGGSLVIEHTEALTVIDVNTARNVGSTSLRQTILANNLEAAVEIPRQLRLRDIGGIIVVDFVDMDEKEDRKEVVSALREALSAQSTRTWVGEITPLGLLEISRRRVGEGLLESLSLVCEVCDGWGRVLDGDPLGMGHTAASVG